LKKYLISIRNLVDNLQASGNGIMKTLRIASRASKLAIVQAGIVKDILEKVVPQTEILIEGIHTRGDRDRSDFLYKSEFVGLFTSEVEKALLDGRADLAVHSLKDLPTVARAI